MTRMRKYASRAIGLLVESEDPKLVEKVLDIFLTDVEPAPRMEALHAAWRIPPAGRV
ncbi:MAG: hypothetical protein M0C28_36230 [Candidatus Moduliflexus flocculans]|nr:hypothetical protein [Candidatus Moduliflexus flocculans]